MLYVTEEGKPATRLFHVSEEEKPATRLFYVSPSPHLSDELVQGLAHFGQLDQLAQLVRVQIVQTIERVVLLVDRSDHLQDGKIITP